MKKIAWALGVIQIFGLLVIWNNYQSHFNFWFYANIVDNHIIDVWLISSVILSLALAILIIARKSKPKTA